MTGGRHAGFVGAAILVGLVGFGSLPARAASPVCDMLDRPERLALMSSVGRMMLKMMCTGYSTAPAPAPIMTSSPVPPTFGSDILVNDRTTDSFPNITQSETSIAVYDDQILVGFNDSAEFFRPPSFNFAGYARSLDGGRTWTDMGTPTTPLGDVQFVCGDPVLVADRPRVPTQTGLFYFSNSALDFSFTSIASVHKTEDAGSSWAQAANASPLALNNEIQDKPWIAVDTRATGAGAGNVYACWTRFDAAMLTTIQFSRSTDGGATFSQFALTSGAADVELCQVAVNPLNGYVYVSWTDFGTFGVSTPAIHVARSTTNGASFDPEVVVGAADFAETVINCGSTPDLVFVDSEAGGDTRAVRSLEGPSMTVDPTSGNIYQVWHRANLPGGSGADVAFSSSVDGGTTWSMPLRINSVVTGQQFFPSIAVNSDGAIRVMYYSTQGSPTDRRIDVYAVASNDGGTTWSDPIRVTDVSFDRPTTNPNFDPLVADCYMGDYNSISAAAPGLGGPNFFLAWGDNRLNANPGAADPPDPDVRVDIQEPRPPQAPAPVLAAHGLGVEVLLLAAVGVLGLRRWRRRRLTDPERS